MNRTRLASVLIALALVCALAFLVVKTRAVNSANINEIVGTLRQLKQIDAEWNVDVLRSKTGLNTNYDPVASPLPLIASLETVLQNYTTDFLSGQPESQGKLLGLLDAYKKAMNEKINMVETFKSQNSILRNSSRFLPTAATQLIEASRASAADADTKRQIEETLNTLLTNTMTYTLTPEQSKREEIEQGIVQLQQRAATLPTEVQDLVGTFVAHTGTIVRQQQASNRLLTELSALPTASAIDQLSDAHAQEYEKLLTEQQGWQKILIAYSAFLLLLLAWLGWRLFKSYRTLNNTNTALQQTNYELKESQVQLVQAEKMSALGQMVAGIAHEINTPLAYIKGTLDLLTERQQTVHSLAQNSYRFTQLLRAPEKDKAALQMQYGNVESVSRELVENGVLKEVDTLLHDGIHGIEQISEIVLNLKNFSRLDRAKVSEFSVQDGLNSTLLLARSLLKNTVEIKKEFYAVPTIQCSPSQVNQVFLNIITNAAHALEGRAEKGVITLRTSAANGGKSVRIDIEDNGTGIPPSVIKKIFDPFFTTKPIGKGTGMGLSISYKIIQEHGGELLVESVEGEGTFFSIILPVQALQSPAKELEMDGFTEAPDRARQQPGYALSPA